MDWFWNRKEKLMAQVDDLTAAVQANTLAVETMATELDALKVAVDAKVAGAGADSPAVAQAIVDLQSAASRLTTLTNSVSADAAALR
jgi:hypothetical protein